jgi:6-pyruvoyltetrahydropterin/6-carboxytetrahydropterin synthase
MTYEVGAATSLRAMHTMPVEGSEGELHAHDYRVEVVATRSELDARGMVVDLDVLRAAMGAVLEPLRDTDLGSIAPAGAEGVTVEVFARWVHDALADTLAAEGAQTLRTRVWESETEFAGYAADLPGAERGVPAET